MIVLPGGPEAYLPPRVFDRAVANIDIKGRLKPAMKVDKDQFSAPDNPKAPKTSFIVGRLMKFHFGTRKEMEESKMVYDRDSDPKVQGKPTAKGEDEEEEEDEDDS